MQKTSKLANFFPFKDLSVEELSKIATEIKFETVKYQKGDFVYSPEHFEKKIGFVISGKCEVYKLKHTGPPMPLNTLSRGDSFGVLAAFSKETQFPTAIVAKTICEIAFMSACDLTRLCENNSRVAMNVILFMADRISFLNGKIATYSRDSIRDKMAVFIQNERKKQGTDTIRFNCKKCSEILNAGRASVYRAIEQLTKLGIISFNNKQISVLDAEALMEMTK